MLDTQLLNEMHAHAVSTFPEECCGLMVGTFEGISEREYVKKVKRLKRTKNVFSESSERNRRYTISPEEILKADKEASDANEEIVGVYHSHPDGKAIPSTFDLGCAWPSLSYIVMEVRDRKVQETISWVLKEDGSRFLLENMEVRSDIS